MKPVRPEVYIYDFTPANGNEVIEQIDHIVDELGSAQPIIIHIDSYGGRVDVMSKIYNKLKSIENPIFTYTSSMAMSCGAIILATAAPKGNRFAADTARIMIHEMSGGTRGQATDLEDQHAEFLRDNELWLGILARSMGLKTQSDVRKLIKKSVQGTDLMLDAKAAKKLGLIDHIGIIKLQQIYGFQIVVSK